MRNIIGLILLMFCFSSVIGQQQEFCGTKMSEKQLEWLRDFRQAPYDVKTDEITYIPIQFHITGTDDGEGYYSIASVMQLLCDLNSQFEEAGFYFFIKDNEFIYHNNTNYYDNAEDYNPGNMFNIHGVDNAVNVFMVADPAGNCGYYSPNGDALAVAKSCAGAGDNTLAHEIGHYFSMPHTFSGWEGRDMTNPISQNQMERVARTGPTANCNNRGDYFCDTDADYISSRWNCPYTLDWEDPDGVPINPDVSLIMSYVLDNCSYRFSPQQIQAMKANLFNQREDLLDYPQELNFAPIAQTAQFYPAKGVTNISPEGVLLKWKEIPNATKYYLNVFAPSTGYKMDIFVDSPEYTLSNLEPELKYYWKVGAYNDGNFCLVPPTTFNFTVAEENNILSVNDVQVQTPTCKNEPNGSAMIMVTGGNAPYTYVWENGVEGNSIENVEADNYEVTVTDDDGITQIFTINIPDPVELDVDINQTSEAKAEATISGGTPPYTYTWSNGAENLSVEDLPAGENTLTVTDANGCEQAETISIIRVDVSAVVPVSCNGETDGFIHMDEPVGGTPPYTYVWSNGNETITNANLAAGNYSVDIYDDNGFSTRYSFEVIEPAPLTATLSLNGNTGSVSISGGTPPYDIFWSDGRTGTLEENLANGEYNVIVRDSKDCTFTTEYVTVDVPTDVDELILEQEGIMLVPNPVESGKSFNIIFNLPTPDNITIKVKNSSGNTVFGTMQMFKPGQNSYEISTNGWAAGIYMVQIFTSNQKYSAKLVVL